MIATAECKHERFTRGQVYDYCEDCGAVREINGAWHVCALCRLPGPLPNREVSR